MTADGKFTNDLSAEEEAVRRYFHEVLDQGKVEPIEDLFHPQCVMHRPGGTVAAIDSIRGVAEHRKERVGAGSSISAGQGQGFAS